MRTGRNFGVQWSMTNFTKRAVRVLLIHPDGKLLAVNRRQDPDALCMPGGKVDPGETLVEAARRETAEETGVLIPEDGLGEEARVLYFGEVRNDQAKDQAAYEVSTFCVKWQESWGTPSNQEDGIRPRWVSVLDFAGACAAPEYDRSVLAAWRAVKNQAEEPSAVGKFAP
jgi:8-oxo-dGTP pyrophosphatase MutT (NUDIX family)